MSLVYTFRGDLVLSGALHIGSGGGNEDTDATIIRDAQGKPYIPGSSLRGAFRAAIERLAPTLVGEPYPRDMGELETLLRPQIEEKPEATVQHLLTEELTSIERLFGTTYWASPLTIPDLPLKHEKPAEVAGEIRYGIAIDRDTGAAKHMAKYDFEVLSRGHTFRFLMRCEMERTHQSTWEKLLAIGLRLLEMGELPLGGNLARGIGQVQLENLEVFQFDTNDKAMLKRLLMSGARDDAHCGADDARFGTRLPDAWLKQKVEEL